MYYKYLQEQAKQLVCRYIADYASNVTVKIIDDPIRIHIDEQNLITTLEDIYSVLPIEQLKYANLVQKLLPLVSYIYGMVIVPVGQIIEFYPCGLVKSNVNNNSYVKYNDNLGQEIVSNGVWYELKNGKYNIIFAELVESNTPCQSLLEFLINPVGYVLMYTAFGLYVHYPNNFSNIRTRIDAKAELYDQYIKLCYLCDEKQIILDVVVYIFGILVDITIKKNEDDMVKNYCEDFSSYGGVSLYLRHMEVKHLVEAKKLKSQILAYDNNI